MTDRYAMPIGFRIMSGGQSGADRAGLDWAILHGIVHAGWCPKGRRAEDGRIGPVYLLDETPRTGYLQRTAWNVRDSDATVIFTLTDALDGGSKKTSEFANKHGRPCLHFHAGIDPNELTKLLVAHRVTTLNVAGKRESAAPGIYRFAFESLNHVLMPALVTG